MTLLAGLRGLFVRWGFMASDRLPGTATERSAPRTDIEEEVAAAEIEAEHMAEPAEEPEPPVAIPVPEGLTAAEAEDLFARERNKIATLLGALDTRIGAHAAETQRLAQKTEQLPRLVEGVTEIKAQCGRTLELLHETLTQSRSSEGAVAAAVQRITEASSHDVEELERIRRLIETNTQAIRKSSEAAETVTENLREIAEVAGRLQTAIAGVDRAGQNREATFAKLLRVHKRSMTLFAFGCCLASLLALAVALMAIFV